MEQAISCLFIQWMIDCLFTVFLKVNSIRYRSCQQVWFETLVVDQLHGKPVVHGLGKWISKIQDWHLIIAITTDLHKSVPFTEKQPRKRETGIKDGFEAPFGTFLPGNQDCLFRWSVVPKNFPLKGPKSSVLLFLPTRFSWKLLQMVKKL